MTQRHFCTYFDHRYLARGLALHASLSRHSPDCILWVLCLSDVCAQALRQLARPGLRPVTLAELEHFDPELAACKGNRSLVEYYFTCSPCLPRYVFQMVPSTQSITYLDSDLYFFADAEEIFRTIGNCSVGITPHRFTPRAQSSHGKFGKYNVGLLYFRRDVAGLACLEWWRQQCIHWCYDRLEGERYADQKYLEQFEGLFPGVCNIDHPGVNLAPWNIATHTMEASETGPKVDGRPLIFFHFQGIRKLSRQRYDSNLSGYGARLSPTARDHVFLPYLKELSALEEMLVRDGILNSIEPGVRREAVGLLAIWRRFKRDLRQVRAGMLGNIVRF